MSRRLDTNLRLSTEAERLQAAANVYRKQRYEYIQFCADRLQLKINVKESDRIYDLANGISQGVFSEFKKAVDREMKTPPADHPVSSAYSALEDWMDDEMSDIEKARREIAHWLDMPQFVAFDTETTGINKRGEPVIHVPVTAAACTLEEISLCDITLAPLNAKGEFVNITEGASRANHLTDTIIQEYPPLETNEAAIISLESLMKDGRKLLGYNTQFDRDMICRALSHALKRIEKDNDFPPYAEPHFRIEKILDYFNNPVNWLETKDVFCRAIGIDSSCAPGWSTRMEDIARATNALLPSENQEHGALADCQLLARIIRNIRKELEQTMATKTPKTVAKQTEEIQTEPENTGEWPADALEHIATLEQALRESEARAGEYASAVSDLTNEVRRLNAACESYANADGAHQHHEARDITWSDIEINGFRFNFTRREGETVDQSINAILDHVRVLQAVRDMEKVVTFRVGLKDYWKDLKGFDKPANQPAAEQPAQPKSNGNQPPAANKPAPAKPATPPQQPAQGKTTGEKKSQLCDRIVRHDVDGKSMFDLLYNLSNGKPSEYPLVPSKKDTPTLEKAIIAAGYEIASLEPGETYDLPILVEWTVGDQIPKSDPPKFYRNNMTFTVQQTEPF